MNAKAKTTEKFRITGDWARHAKVLKEKYSQLTDTDLILEDGREEELLARMQRRLSRNRDGVIEILKSTEPSTPKEKKPML